MADGYAQATRNAAFVNLHAAAGVGHALGNVFTAFRNQTPMVIVAGQQARSLLPLQPFLYAERASEFPRPYVKYSVEPARAEDVPAAIARAYYEAMQPPCGPTFVSVPIDDWVQTCRAARVVQADQPRRCLPETGCDRAACCRDRVRAKKPAFVVGPCDRQGASGRCHGSRSPSARGHAVWVSPFSHRCSFPEIHPLFAGFLHASPGQQLSDALRGHDLVVVFGAPVFTFHVEGHADIFHERHGACGTSPTMRHAASVTPVWRCDHRDDEAGAGCVVRAKLPETKRAAPAPRVVARASPAARAIRCMPII